MIQIGVHNTGYYSSAAVFRDGEIIFASKEERLSRIKYDNNFPWKCIERGLDINGLNIDDVDEVIIAWNPFINSAGRYRAGYSKWVSHPMQRLYSNLNHILPRLSYSQDLIDISEETINYINGKKVRFIFVNHYLAHIAMSYYTSPFDVSAIMASDGYGEKSSTVYAKYSGEKGVEIIKMIDFPHSLGMFYAAFTEFIGFRPEIDEWKLMGASAFGNPDIYYDRIKQLVTVYDNGDYELDLSYFNFYNYDTPFMFSRKFVDAFGDYNSKGYLSQREFDIAAAVQRVFEDTVLRLLDWLNKETGIDNLSVGGGIFMNSLLNGKIEAATGFKNVFIPFSPDDAGNAIGAVLYRNGTKMPYLMPYLSEDYSSDEIREVLNKYMIKYSEYDEGPLLAYTADMMASGRITGWFQGKSEFGHRALGNRSILADPRRKETRDKINSAVKYREYFRPFAPSVLYRHGKEYFDNYTYTPYMERVLNYRKEVTGNIQAVVHEDNTGRLQTVVDDNNPLFSKLLDQFYRITDIPILLNTSFNKAGEPIVYSPDDAIKTFYTSGMDVLVMDRFVVEKKKD